MSDREDDVMDDDYDDYDDYDERYDSHDPYDVAIIGGGPAAMAAALHLARAGRTVRVFEREVYGGAMVDIPSLENYPGYTGSGEGLAEKMHDQAEDAGAEFSSGECTRLITPISAAVSELPGDLIEDGGFRRSDRFFILRIDDDVFLALTVIVATGTTPRMIELPVGIDKPVSTCVTCDGPLYKGKRVVVLGGGDSAVSGALYLSDIAEFVDVVNRSPLKANGATVDKLAKRKNVSIHERLDPQKPSAEYKQLLRKADGVFMFLGSKPATDFINADDLLLGDSPEGSINSMMILRNKMMDRFNFPEHENFMGDIIPHVIDKNGFIHTTVDQETVVDGLFAAGDCCLGAKRQIVSAAASGTAAAKSALRYLTNAFL